MPLVLRCNFSDESIALIEFIYQQIKSQSLEKPLHSSNKRLDNKIYVVYIDTGWTAKNWLERVETCFSYVKRCGFEPITLKPPQDFSQMVLDRKSFPSAKFQWCVSFLKGLPLLNWLDEHDPSCEWTIALPKRQALYPTPIPEHKPECEYHGERDVWHPLYNHSDKERNNLIKQAGFKPLNHRSLECCPCIKNTINDIKQLHPDDIQKTHQLEQTIQSPMFAPPTFGPQKGIKAAVHWAKQQPHNHEGLEKAEGIEALKDFDAKSQKMEHLTMGCGDPFGCGL